jgi:hypothetical protein
MCALLVGLPDVTVIGVGEWPSWLRVVVAIDSERPGCSCGGIVHCPGAREFVLVDLPVFGRPARLVWRTHRWRCLGCGRCWCDDDPEIGTSRCSLTTRAARWATLQVGRHGRCVGDVARNVGCGWHTVRLLRRFADIQREYEPQSRSPPSKSVTPENERAGARRSASVSIGSQLDRR